MTENDITTIRVSEKTKEIFDKIGTRDMTADEVLKTICEFWNKNKK